MKKDIFNGKIKPGYISYIITTIVVVTAIFLGCGALLVYMVLGPLADNSLSVRILLSVIGVISLLIGISDPFLTVFVIKKYPEYKKLRKLVLNSDNYFVGENDRSYRGTRRGRGYFEAATQIADRNKGLGNIKFPPKYWIYVVLTITGIILLFANLVAAYLTLENIEVLPEFIQNEVAVFAIFMAVEVFDMVLSIVFAFRVKKIRKITIEEYKGEIT